jgi:energy-coupling factor transporter ATP-binding protein EcfA2
MFFCRRRKEKPTLELKSEPSEDKYLTAEGRDLFLILGNSGGGQSTFANYMAGLQMEKTPYGTVKLKPGQQEICKTDGQSPNSITTFPQVVLTNKNIELLDCPAINCNSLSVETTFFATQQAILQAKSIQGIAIILSYNDIYNIYLLEKTITDFFQQKDSILFFVTQAPDHANYDDVLKTLKKHADNEIRDNHGCTHQQIFYDWIKNNPEKLQFFDPTNENKREQIATQLEALKPLPKEFINIPGYEEARVKIYEEIELLTKILAELVNQKIEFTNQKFDTVVSPKEKDNINCALKNIDIAIKDCSELIQLKSLRITMMTKTDQASVNQYRNALKQALVVSQEMPVNLDKNDLAEEKRSFNPR